MSPRTWQGEYDCHVRRILSGLEAKGKVDASVASTHRRHDPGRPITAPSIAQAPTEVGKGTDVSSRRHQEGEVETTIQGEGFLPSPTRSAQSGVNSNRTDIRRRPVTAVASVGSRLHRCGSDHGGGSSRPRRKDNGTSRSDCASSLAPAHGAFDQALPGRAKGLLAGAAAMVVGGPRASETVSPLPKAAVGRSSDRVGGRGGEAPDDGGNDGEDGVLSPRAAKKVLPHFLAIGNPGSQALVPKEGADIVNRQAMSRFKEVKARNRRLDNKEREEMRRRQALKWKEYEGRITQERKRLKDHLVAVKVQGELQKEAREGKKAAEFLSGNPDPGRAYPCRTEFNLDKEARWRRAWCSDLEAQIELKQRLKGEASRAEASRDRTRASQLEAAIKADRRREAKMDRLDKARIHRVWEEQVQAFAYPGCVDRRGKHFMLDKIVT